MVKGLSHRTSIPAADPHSTLQADTEYNRRVRYPPASAILAALEGKQITIMDWSWAAGEDLGTLFHLIGFGGLVLLLTSIYMVMPVGRIPLRHALVAGLVGGVLWELTRRFLIWYFSTLSYVNFLYGSFAATIVTLLSMEAGAVIVLLGGQFIAEYERRAPNGRFGANGAEAGGVTTEKAAAGE